MSTVHDFIALFKKALRDKDGSTQKSNAQKEKDYYALNSFITRIKQPKEVMQCLDAYLKLYKDYLPDDPRSKMVFAHLLSKRLEATSPEDKFITYLSETIADKKTPFTDPVKLRYEVLLDKEKADIKSTLDFKLKLKKQNTSVLDLLKEAFEKEKKAKPSIDDLLQYKPVENPGLYKKFQSFQKDCQATWGKKDAANIEGSLGRYIEFLRNEKDILNLFQILKWTRDIVTDAVYEVDTDRSGRTIKYKYLHDHLDAELYLQAAFRILIWARVKLYMKNRWDFTPEEKSFFIDPLKKEYYYCNFYNRFEQGRQDEIDMEEASVLFIRLLLFARISGGTLANNDEIKKVTDILKDKSRKKELKERNFYLNIGRDLFKGYVRLGSLMGKCRVIYFDTYTNDREEFIYIEFVDVKNVLIKVSSTQLSIINESSFYIIVWESTRHLLVLIPAFWQLIGYAVTLLTGGAFALVKEILFDVALAEVGEHLNLSGDDAQTALFTAVSLFRKGKISPANFEKAASKGFKNLGKEEAKAANAMLKLSDAELKAARAAGKITEEELKAIKSASKYLQQDVKAVESVAQAETKIAGTGSKGIGSKVDGSRAITSAQRGVPIKPNPGIKPDAVLNNGTGKFTGGNYPRSRTYKMADPAKLGAKEMPKMPPDVTNIGHVAGIGIPKRLVKKLLTPTLKEQVEETAKHLAISKRSTEKAVSSIKKTYKSSFKTPPLKDADLLITKTGDTFHRKTGQFLGNVGEEAKQLAWMKSHDGRLFKIKMVNTFKDNSKKIIDAIENRHTLRGNIGLTDPASQAHHLIPVEVLKNNRVAQSAVAGGFEFNGVRNGLGLKQNVHLTGHNEYNKLLEQRLDGFAKAKPNYTPQDARKFLEKEVIPEWELNFISF